MVKISKEHNKISFHLKEIMDKKEFSKNKLCKETNLRFETIQGYYNGSISRVDLYVLEQLCTALDCNINDIIRYNK